MKSENFKSKLEQFFITCRFQFFAEVALFMIIYCSVQIIYKHAVYPAVYILPSIFSGVHSGCFALITSQIVGPALPQQTCIKMNTFN